MTVSSTIARKTYAGNGVTVAFDYPGYTIVDADITVVLTNDTTGAETPWVLSTDYTMSVPTADRADGVRITAVTAPATGETLVVYTDPALTQELDLVENDANPAEPRERAWDKLTLIVQRLADRLNRSMTLSDGDVSTASLTLPSPSADKLLGWADDGLSIENKDLVSTAEAATAGDSYVLQSDGTVWRARSYLAALANGVPDAAAQITARTTLAAAYSSDPDGDLPIADGGTGASTVGGALDNFGLTSAIGNINDPILHMPLRHDLSMLVGAGAATFSRSSTATYVDRNGVVQSAAIDEARFEKDGLLVEGASTNLLTYSAQFDNAAWTKTRATVTADATAAPDGNTTADKFVEDATASATHNTDQQATVDTDSPAAFSIFVKAGERDRLFIKYSVSAASSNNIQTLFDIDENTVDPVQENGTATGGFASIEELANGWYRCTIGGALNGGNVLTTVQLFLDDGTGTSYTGDGTSGLYIWGAQLEALPFASNYIPTTTAAATRAKDEASVTPAENMPYLSADSYHSVLIDFDVLGIRAAAGVPQEIFSSQGGNYSILRIKAGTDDLVSYISSTDKELKAAITANTTYRIGQVWDAGTHSGYVDGVQVFSVSDAPNSAGASTSVKLGDGGSLGQLFGHIKNFRIYDRALSATEMRLA